MSDFGEFSSEQVRQLLEEWLKKLGLWQSIVVHPSIAPLLTNDADRAELDKLRRAKRDCEEQFAEIDPDTNPSPELQEKHRRELEAHDRKIAAAEKKERRSYFAKRSLLDVDVMFVAINLVALDVNGIEASKSLTKLSWMLAGHSDENPPKTRAEKRNITRIRVSLIGHILRVEKHFGLFDVEIINEDDENRKEYRIAASELLRNIFKETFLPKLKGS